MIAFIEDQRIVYGVESICRVLPIAPSIARQVIAQQSAERGHITTAWRASLIRPKLRNAISGTQCYGQKSSVSGMRITKSMGSARRGIS